MKQIDFIFWTEVLEKQQRNLEKEIQAYITKPTSYQLYIIKANAIHISLTAERIAALEGVKL